MSNYKTYNKKYDEYQNHSKQNHDSPRQQQQQHRNHYHQQQQQKQQYFDDDDVERYDADTYKQKYGEKWKKFASTVRDVVQSDGTVIREYVIEDPGLLDTLSDDENYNLKNKSTNKNNCAVTSSSSLSSSSASSTKSPLHTTEKAATAATNSFHNLSSRSSSSIKLNKNNLQVSGNINFNDSNSINLNNNNNNNKNNINNYENYEAYYQSTLTNNSTSSISSTRQQPASSSYHANLVQIREDIPGLRNSNSNTSNNNNNNNNKQYNFNMTYCKSKSEFETKIINQKSNNSYLGHNFNAENNNKDSVCLSNSTKGGSNMRKSFSSCEELYAEEMVEKELEIIHEQGKKYRQLLFRTLSHFD
jgi:hypothetical protein